uniref:WAP domain-containing protein n=1 Tax=Nothobranchius furzeri TaxID=105023 RepID=A0A8C6Q682_NOTFU
MAHSLTVAAMIVMTCAVEASQMVHHHEKPGFCGDRRGVRVICNEQCSGNWDCKHHEICCFNGCGHVCMSPVRVKPGLCGYRRFTPDCRGHVCYNDFQCHGNLKCCSTSCGRSCVRPIYWPID